MRGKQRCRERERGQEQKLKPRGDCLKRELEARDQGSRGTAPSSSPKLVTFLSLLQCHCHQAEQLKPLTAFTPPGAPKPTVAMGTPGKPGLCQPRRSRRAVARPAPWAPGVGTQDGPAGVWAPEHVGTWLGFFQGCWRLVLSPTAWAGVGGEAGRSWSWRAGSLGHSRDCHTSQPGQCRSAIGGEASPSSTFCSLFPAPPLALRFPAPNELTGGRSASQRASEG